MNASRSTAKLGPCSSTCDWPTEKEIQHEWTSSTNSRNGFSAGDGGGEATEPLCVGAMPSFLQTKDRLQKVTMHANSKDYEVEYILVPAFENGKPVQVFKSMDVPQSGLYPEQSVKNTFVEKTNWFGTKEVAEQYASNPQTGKDPKVVTFTLLRDIRLFNLGSKSNLAFILAKLEDDQTWLKGQRENLPKGVDQAKTELERQIQYNLDNQDIFKLTTGWGVTLEDQIKLLNKWGTAVTNDYNWKAADEIKGRGFDTNPMPRFDKVDGTSKIPITHIETCSPLTNEVTEWGAGVNQAQRLSFTTDLDARMTEIIVKYVNVDGYYAAYLPSLWSFGDLEEEIALRFPASALSLPNDAPQHYPDAHCKTKGQSEVREAVEVGTAAKSSDPRLDERILAFCIFGLAAFLLYVGAGKYAQNDGIYQALVDVNSQEI